MAVLQKIRDKAGVAVSIIIALALLSFIIDPGTLETVFNSTSSKYDVGVIGGKKIPYTDFQNDVEEMTVFYKFMTNNSNQNDQVQRQIREMVWNDLITKNLFIKNAKAAGINVGTEEMLSLTTGDNPSPIIASHPMFFGEDGTFSSDKVREFVQSLSSQSADATIIWNQIQSSIESQQYMSKYSALFTAASTLNALELGREVAAGNMTADVEYVMKPYSYATDTTVVASDAECKAYYKKNQKDYKQSASRDIKYALYEVVPSQDDIFAASEEFDKLYEEFKTTDNVKSFISSESEYSYDDRWYKSGELNSVSREVNDYAFGVANGVSPIFSEGNTLRAVKVVEAAMVPDSAYVKHIMLQGAGAKATADSLLSELKKGSDFGLIAAAYSVDQQSAADGQLGNLGWLTQNYMFPGMESVLTAKVGEPYIVKTSYGTHIVCVTKKSAPIAKKKVAVLERTASPSKATYAKYYADANALATLAGGTAEGLEKAADSLGVVLNTQNKISEATESYSGVDQAKEITRWAFDAKKGKTSSIITINNNYYFVVALTGINKEGYTPYETVKPGIEQMLIGKKSQQKQKEEFAAAIAGKSLEEIAADASTEVVTSSAMSLSGRPGQNDPALAGAAFSAPEGKVCGPVAGRTGMYVVKVGAKESGSFFTEQDAKESAEQMAQYSSQNILPVMIEEGDVKDNRARFY